MSPTAVKDPLEILRAPFPQETVKWRPGKVTNDKTKALALAYVDARDVMERLDKAFGAAGWADSYRVIEEHQAVEATITANGVSKSDVGYRNDPDNDQSKETEPYKSAYSDAFKRAAVKWGIGRDLYDTPQFWIEIDEYKKFKTTPTFDTKAGKWVVATVSPIRSAPAPVPAPVEQAPEVEQSNGLITAAQRTKLLTHAKSLGLTETEIKAGVGFIGHGKKSTKELTVAEFEELLGKMDNDPGFVESLKEVKSVG